MLSLFYQIMSWFFTILAALSIAGYFLVPEQTLLGTAGLVIPLTILSFIFDGFFLQKQSDTEIRVSDNKRCIICGGPVDFENWLICSIRCGNIIAEKAISLEKRLSLSRIKIKN